MFKNSNLLELESFQGQLVVEVDQQAQWVLIETKMKSLNQHQKQLKAQIS